MNCNVYINDDLYDELEHYKKTHHQSRNSIITTALKEWLNLHKDREWPETFFNFPQGMENLYPGISELRRDILPPKELKF